jgi:hypothetical protein
MPLTHDFRWTDGRADFDWRPLKTPPKYLNQERRLKTTYQARFLFLLLGLQALFAFVILPVWQIQAIFPFSRWDLFTAPTRERIVPLIYVRSAQGRDFSPPVEAHRFFRESGIKINYIEGHDYLMKELRHLSASGRKFLSPDVVGQVARRFFGGVQPVEFDVRRARVNSVDFFRDGSVLWFETLGVYTYADGNLDAK